IPRIMGKLIEKGHSVYWIVVGMGCRELLDRFSDWAHRDRLVVVEELSPEAANNVPCNELVDYYQQADVFVMLSRIETFGIVLIEAMAAGLPVVYYDAPGVRDVMQDRCGIKVPLADDDAMAEAVDRLLKDNRIATELSERAMEYAQTYSWDNIAQKYRSVYEGCR
ncbi:MAG: glycosyltransferase family 4 protein, partial [Candidatus Omnitrophota bacterium]